ncbi:MAG: galactose-1-phosphate uridylyltransferase [Armatimonadetes bacterium]|nr:galactose-1-phosphate uridylyltransferase [Armatimonadota bacterium]
MGETVSQRFPPELRRDPVTGVWVIIADRAGRPSGSAEERELPKESCPFCPGHESITPSEVYAVRPGGGEKDGPGWVLRVVPNKFQALSPSVALVRSGFGLYDQMTGRGVHEVIIETPEHDANLFQMPRAQLRLVIDTYAQRLQSLREDASLRHVVIFRNYRAVAGASLRHPHSQIIALPIVPRLVKDKLMRAREYYVDRERCIFCDLLQNEAVVKERIVSQNRHFVALIPYAARFPYELQIYPLRHQHDLLLMTDEERWGLVDILKDTLARYYCVLGDHEKMLNVPYNMVIETAPNCLPRPGRPDYWGTIQLDYHWHIQLIPRLTKMAGFEWGTGFFINVIRPERAAEELRAADTSRVMPAAA